MAPVVVVIVPFFTAIIIATRWGAEAGSPSDVVLIPLDGCSLDGSGSSDGSLELGVQLDRMESAGAGLLQVEVGLRGWRQRRVAGTDVHVDPSSAKMLSRADALIKRCSST